MVAPGLQLARGRRLARTSWGGFGPGFIWISSPLVSGPLVFFDAKPQGGDLPANFGNAEAADIEVRARTQDASGDLRLYAQIFESDELTPLTDEVLCVVLDGADTSFANYVAQFTGVDTVADKATWDGARVRFRWSST